MDVPQVFVHPREWNSFQLLWQTVGSVLRCRHGITEEEIEECMEAMQTVFRTGHRYSEFMEINFDYLPNRVAYIIRYATCHTSLTKFAADEFFEKAPEGIGERLLKQPEINLVSLGGGPGNDLIGFCSSLQEKRFARELNNLPLRFKATVMDYFEGYGDALKEVMNEIYQRDFGSVSDFFKTVLSCVDFKQVNLTKELPDIYEELQITKEADVILMVKVLSILKEKDKVPMLQTILNQMKPGALFLFIDREANFLLEAIKNHNVQLLMCPTEKRQLVMEGAPHHCITKSSFQVCVVQGRNQQNDSSFQD